MKPTPDAPTQDAAPMSSFSLPVVTGNAAEHDTPTAPDAVGAMFDQAAANADPAEPGYGKTYWRSIEEKLQTPEFLETVKGEFPVGADLPPTGVQRRDFLQLLGASMALAGVGTACSTRPVDEKMLAYTKTPDALTPGVPQHYASAISLDGVASGVLVRAWEGRPTKVEGNPEHPINRGATGAYEQAYLMDLYSPARARRVLKGDKPKALRAFNEELTARLVQMQADGGAKLRFLLEPSASPLQAHLRQRILQRFPNAKFYAYTSVSRSAAVEGAQVAFGRPLEASYDFSQADVVLSLDSDFLQTGPEPVRYSREYSNRRDPKVQGGMNRHYQVESQLTITGGMADERLRVRAADVLGVAAAVAQGLGVGELAGAAARFPLAESARPFVQALVEDLRRAGRRAVVVAGDRQPAAVHALALALNQALGSIGTTVQLRAPLLNEPATGFASLRQLAQEIEAGQVDTLLITAQNPVYSAPADLDLAALLRKVPNSIYCGLFENETSRAALWVVPATHAFEAWGDGRSADGTVTLTQPLINPLYGGLSEPELLALFLSEPYRSSYQLLRDFWRGQSLAANFDVAWEGWVQAGFVPGSAAKPEQASVQLGAVAQALQAAPAPKGGLELNFVADYSVLDGRFFNNPYLQELPDPISKLVWDNAAYMSRATAEKLGVVAGDYVDIAHRGRTVRAPVWVLPGHADESITLPLGYGQMAVFNYYDNEGAQTVGFNAGALRFSDAPSFDAGAQVTKAKAAQHKFAQTQIHWSLNDPVPDTFKGLVRQRPHVVEQTFADYQKQPGRPAQSQKSLPPEANVLPEFNYAETLEQGYKWGMAIDLSRCTGCSACVIACQTENNIPVVGKEQVDRGREMLWLRIDRYFAGDEANAEMVMQPMMCVHCEKAPCEYVCPVNATVHSEEGLNVMVYNRCVGTRYCSNNCPYKVRRFNYLHYTSGKSQTEKMMMNPDVTVRARGVMEKCTYCVQRIERARINTRVAAAQSGDPRQGFIKDGTLKTACQQACPAEAIVFGTLSDPTARVTQLHKDERAYKVLNELGTQPRTVYLMRIKNPHPALAAARAQAHSNQSH
jgi:molybdopterin-containing oxidoreductase family iron-sulfur binding subunit